MISLVKDTISQPELNDLADWLKRGPRLTKGPLTEEYERKWASFLGVNHAVFVNSGSSAILLGLYSLLATGKLKKGDSVVVPALSWATDVAPIEQLGLKPILCDCNLYDLSVDLNHLSDILCNQNPSCLLLVSVLGLVPDMNSIIDLCNKHNIILLEDNCESLGSSFHQSKLGTFGLMSFFSTYFGHHLSTIEGGMITTDDSDLFNVLKSLRSHGWDRDMSASHQQELRKSWGVSDDFESLYKFYYFGFNLRSTDLQAFLGLSQLKRLENYIEIRNSNYTIYQKLLTSSAWNPPPSSPDRYISSMAYPLLLSNRKDTVQNLKNSNIETRPLICGSLGRQPFWIKKYGKTPLPNADRVDREGLYLPNHPELSSGDLDLIASCVNSSIK